VLMQAIAGRRARNCISGAARWTFPRGTSAGRRCRGAADDATSSRRTRCGLLAASALHHWHQSRRPRRAIPGGRPRRRGTCWRTPIRQASRCLGSKAGHARLRGNVSALGVRLRAESSCVTTQMAGSWRSAAALALASRTRSRPPALRAASDTSARRGATTLARRNPSHAQEAPHDTPSPSFALAAVLVTLNGRSRAATYGQSARVQDRRAGAAHRPARRGGQATTSRGFEIVRDMINERGGVRGKKLVFTWGRRSDPTAAATRGHAPATREGVIDHHRHVLLPPLRRGQRRQRPRQNVIYWETSAWIRDSTKRGL